MLYRLNVLDVRSVCWSEWIAFPKRERDPPVLVLEELDSPQGCQLGGAYKHHKRPGRCGALGQRQFWFLVLVYGFPFTNRNFGGTRYTFDPTRHVFFVPVVDGLSTGALPLFEGLGRYDARVWSWLKDLLPSGQHFCLCIS